MYLLRLPYLYYIMMSISPTIKAQLAIKYTFFGLLCMCTIVIYRVFVEISFKQPKSFKKSPVHSVLFCETQGRHGQFLTGKASTVLATSTLAAAAAAIFYSAKPGKAQALGALPFVAALYLPCGLERRSSRGKNGTVLIILWQTTR